MNSFLNFLGGILALHANGIDSENEVEIVKSIVDSFCQIHQESLTRVTSTPSKNMDQNSQLTFHSPLSPPIVKSGTIYCI
jgi:hypothetical protein